MVLIYIYFAAVAASGLLAVCAIVSILKKRFVLGGIFVVVVFIFWVGWIGLLVWQLNVGGTGTKSIETIGDDHAKSAISNGFIRR